MTTISLGNDIVIYTASKNAGSTVRKWITDIVSNYILNREGLGNKKEYSESELGLVAPRFSRPLSDTVLSRTQASTASLANALRDLGITYRFGFFAPMDKRHRFCIKRDPLQRFISCATQKIGQPPFSKIVDVEHLINDFDLLCNQPLRGIPLKPNYNEEWNTWANLIIPRHFAPQYITYGDHTKYYQQCFDMSDIDTHLREILEDYFNVDIPVETVNKGSRPLKLTEQQIQRVRKIYRRDYEIGYC